MLNDSPSLLKKTKLGFIFSKEKISCLFDSSDNCIISSSFARFSFIFPNKVILLSCFNNTVSKGDLVKTLVNLMKLEIIVSLDFIIISSVPEPSIKS